jgi:glycosyltransferase involved in cell wall biosynthesis
MKVAVYTIAKDEEHNVNKFMDSIEGADVYVLDTGSSDNTVNLLKKRGAFVKQEIITPWRFDTARNLALEMIPEDVDVCVSIDMDEVLEPGWEKKLKQEWQGNIGNYRYIAEWKDEAKTIPAVIAPRTRIHSRQGFEWYRKVHEVIRPLPNVELDPCDTTILVKHYQNGIQRNYSGALDDIIQEDPTDADARLQRGGELFQKKQWKAALQDYMEYLKILYDDNRPVLRYRKSSAWIAVAYCHNHLGDTESSYRAILSAVAAEPINREAWAHLAYVASQMNNKYLAYGCAMTAWKIKEAPYHAAIDSFLWGDYPKQLADNMFAKIMENK